MTYEAVIGLEVHVQLRTGTKLFCRCANAFGEEPNSSVCPVCLGYPGALPVPNREAIDQATRLALALGCDVQMESWFARKSYFYPDLPKGYQISQFEEPLALGGAVPVGDGRSVRLRRIHLEEDAGKLLHEAPGGGSLPGLSLVDFNRCGVPLVEIVSEPELRTEGEAEKYLRVLHQVLLYTGTSEANLEEGSMRCDANISLRELGAQQLGTKVEIKNLNSFRHVSRAIAHEIERQGLVLERGGEIVQETRGFDDASGSTRPLRSKEDAEDYRYFPDPDLGPLVLAAERIESLRAALPELPWLRQRRFVDQYQLSEEVAEQLCHERSTADFFERVLACALGLMDEASAGGPADNGPAAAAANWVIMEVGRERRGGQDLDLAMAPIRLAKLIRLVLADEISYTAAKRVFSEIWGRDEEPEAAVERLMLRQVSDDSEIDAWLERTFSERPGLLDQLLAGEQKVAGFVVGQVMRFSGGKADPQAVRHRIEARVEAAKGAVGLAVAAEHAPA